MSPESKINELAESVRRATIPKEAEWVLQEYVFDLLQKKVSRNNLISFLGKLQNQLVLERENESRTIIIANFNAVIELIEDYKSLI